MRWSYRKKKIVVKMIRGVLGNFTLIFVDTINNCILHEYHAPIRNWEKWELEVVYGIFRMELQEMME
jgi:hypothetical protein